MISKSLSNNIFERRSSTGSGLFAILGHDFEQSFRQNHLYEKKTLGNICRYSVLVIYRFSCKNKICCCCWIQTWKHHVILKGKRVQLTSGWHVSLKKVFAQTPFLSVQDLSSEVTQNVPAKTFSIGRIIKVNTLKLPIKFHVANIQRYECSKLPIFIYLKEIYGGGQICPPPPTPLCIHLYVSLNIWELKFRAV